VPAQAARPPRASTSEEGSGSAPVSADVAIAHFQELLRAKQERVRQGPAYPAANAYTGRHDVSVDSAHENIASQEPSLSNAPDPEAVYGASTAHGRGNQGMRKPK
jgi:hypothetical protein